MLNHEWMRQRERRVRPEDPETEPEAQAQGDLIEPSAAPPAVADAAVEPEATVPETPAGEAVVEFLAAEPSSDEPPALPQEPMAVAEPPEPPEPMQEPAPPGDPPVATGVSRPQSDPRRVVENMDVPVESLRDRLDSLLARQAQLPLDIEARHAFSEGVEGSPRETRDALVQRLLDPTLTLEEVALLLGVCRTTVRRYTDRGVLRCYRTPGNQRRFHLTDILDFMERQSRQL